MKRRWLVIALVIALGLLLLFALGGLAQMGPGMMGQGGGGYGGQQYCPYCGGYLGSGGGYYGMGPGMMGPGYGYGMGPGMMGGGYQGYGPQYQLLEKPLQKKDAEAMVEDYIQSLHNSDLKLGKITEKDTSFEAEILGRNKVVVDTIIVDKNTGWMRSAMRGPGRGPGSGYGYGGGPGMMGRGMGPGMMGQGYGPQYQQERKPLTEKDVKAMLENYVQSTRNPNLKLGKITEKDHYFEAEILTKDNALVDKILVDKQTGWMRSTY
ncbi:MAG: hypothetical protein MUO24_06395 [Desulfobacterales bacterium]|nr:hypothetical protein [Desulfobacterales bacterium]